MTYAAVLMYSLCALNGVEWGVYAGVGRLLWLDRYCASSLSYLASIWLVFNYDQFLSRTAERRIYLSRHLVSDRVGVLLGT